MKIEASLPNINVNQTSQTVRAVVGERCFCRKKRGVQWTNWAEQVNPVVIPHKLTNSAIQRTEKNVLYLH